MIARNYFITETVRKQEFRRLKIVRQRLADRALDNAASGEAGGRARLCENDVAEHGERGGNAARRRVGQNRDIQQSSIRVTAYRTRYLGHLQQREHALLHTGAARTGEQHHRQLMVGCILEQTRQLFADNAAHGRHQKMAAEQRDADNTDA